MGFLTGKRALITGIASDRSIAYGIAEAMHREGAELAFTYQNDKLKSRVEKTAAAFGSSIVIHCDVATDDSIAAAFTELGDDLVAIIGSDLPLSSVRLRTATSDEARELRTQALRV